MTSGVLLVVERDELASMLAAAISEALSRQAAPQADAPSPVEALSQRDVLETLGVSRTVLRRLEHEGALVPVRAGRRVLYEAGAVRRYLSQTTAERR